MRYLKHKISKALLQMRCKHLGQAKPPAKFQVARSGTRLPRFQALESRVGDDSNLTLDPDLDTYYLQDIVVTKVPRSSQPTR